MSARFVGWAGAVLATVLVATLANSYYVSLASFILLSSLVCLGLVLLAGYTGLTSFGQAAFVGIGAYVAGYLSSAFAVPGALTLLASVAASVLGAAFIGVLTLSMGGHYLSLATLAWGVVVYFSLGLIEPLGGFNGMGGIPALSLFGFTFVSDRAMFVLIAFIGALAALLARNLLDSRWGRAVRSIRSGSTLPSSFGANPFRLKLAIFCVAAAFAGVSGWLYAYSQRFLNPTPFALNASIEYLFMTVIGGAASLGGAFLGAGVFVVLKQILQDTLPGLLGKTGNFEIVVFGALMLVVLGNAKMGMWPALRRLLPGAPTMKPGDGTSNASSALLHMTPPDRGSELMLSVQGAVKRFGGLVAVNRVSFSVYRGEVAALLGPNGAGKSTMFNLITGVLPLSEGIVELAGARIDGLSVEDIAGRGIARTFQHVKLVGDMSVLENAALGCHLMGRSGWIAAMLRLNRSEERAMRAKAMSQLIRCGLGGLANEMADSLPLGTQRVLEIARALCAEPQLLILDEPAAGLRHKEKQELAGLLKALRAEGVTVLIVDHDMEFIMDIADRLIIMQFGQKIAEGGVDDVRNDRQVQEAYLGVAA